MDNKLPFILGLDVGGGGDLTVCCIRQGWTVKEFRTFNSKDTLEIVNWAKQLIEFYEPAKVGVDGIGIGRGVYDLLRAEFGSIIVFVDARGKTDNKDKFKNRRSQLYFNMAQAFINNMFVIPDNQILVEELSAIKQKDPGDMSVFQIQSKALMSKSPNHADSLMLTMPFDPIKLLQQQKEVESSKYQHHDANSYSWMSA
jgi:hypothetical protein